MQANATPIGSFAKNSALSRSRRVKMSSGNLAYAGALDREIGTMKDPVLASGIGVTPKAAVVFPNAEGTQYMIADGAITQFARVYGAANGKVSATVNGNLIGYALTAAAADGDELEVLRILDTGGLLYSQDANSATVTNTAVETAFNKSATIPANMLKAGDVIRIRGHVRCTATHTTDTLVLKVKVGNTVVMATAAIDVADADAGTFDVTLTIRTIGGAGTYVASSFWGLGASTRAHAMDSTAIDTTVDLAITITATWSAADAGNIVRMDNLMVQRIAA